MNKKKGFTLVELLVVIAILAILATVSVVGYTAFIDKANESNANTEAHQVQAAINAALIDGNDYAINELPEEASADPTTYAVYTVKADGKIYVKTYASVQSEETYAWELQDADPETDGIQSDKIVSAGADITAAFRDNADFAALTGTFKVEGGQLVYTYEGFDATIEFTVQD